MKTEWVRPAEYKQEVEQTIKIQLFFSNGLLSLCEDWNI